jgi:hypothetical protein
MFKMQIQTKEALWICDSCDTWWGSEPTAAPATWRLYRLAEPAATRLGEWRHHCPSWLVAGPDPSVCPECGLKMAKRPLPVPAGAARISLN